MSTFGTQPEIKIEKDLLEKVSDYFNPILVKEIRQSLKSRGFITVFLLMLIASWLISAVGVLSFYGPELAYAEAGRHFFSAFYTVLAIAVFLVVPQGAFRSIQSERDLQTFEMLSITTLSPRKIVWGKWWSSTIQTIVYYAAIAPFMVFTNLLRGISLPFIAFILMWSFIVSTTLAMLAITLSTFSKQRGSFGVLQFLIIFPLLMSLIGLLQTMFTLIGAELPFDDPVFWLMQVVVLTFLVPGFVLLRQIATVQLTFEGANRSTGIRFSCLVLLFVGIGWMLVGALPGVVPSILRFGSSITWEQVIVCMSAGSIWLWLVGLFTSTEDNRLSRRVRQELPQSKFLRVLLIPFLPGGGRGFLYFAMSVLLFTAINLFAVHVSPGGATGPYQINTVITSIAWYLFFYIGLTAFMGRGLRRIGTDLHASHARVLGILTVALGTIGPYLFFFLFEQRSLPPWMMVSNPFYSCYQLGIGSTEAPPVWLIQLLGVLGVALNVVSVFKGIQEPLVYSPNPPRVTAAPVAPVPPTA